MLLTVIAISIGVLFAMNIGASGAAASMGIAYGSGTLTKRTALCLSGIAVFLGAYFGGGEVVDTIGSGIVPGSTFTVAIALIVLAAATLSLLLANLFGIPLSTSEVAVGSVVGAGVVYQSVYVGKLAWIALFWLFTPFVAFVIAVIAATLLKTKPIHQWMQQKKIRPIFAILVVIMGSFEAFSGGMNNVANAVGPLVAAGIIGKDQGIFGGGLAIALGAILFGHRVIETNGKKITDLRLEEGCVLSGTGAGIVMIASLLGIPVPLTQITTSSIIGMGFVKQGIAVVKKDIVVKLLTVWIVSPVLSMVLSYTIIQLVIVKNIYPVIAMAGVMISVLGVLFLVKKTDGRATPLSMKEELKLIKKG
ncbi:anion permease [Neobacillus sp. SM06]|uniref:inorganic phosphate transporter n=1 Tax=Neobacillus sp. SM06 TaxID=3422492 RepID=UPI003D2781E6